jgi:hypothetical protein
MWSAGTGRIGSNNQTEEISRPAGKIRGEFERSTGKDVSPLEIVKKSGPIMTPGQVNGLGTQLIPITGDTTTSLLAPEDGQQSPLSTDSALA